MKKKNFVGLILAILSFIIASIGLCNEWTNFENKTEYATITGENYTIEKESGDGWIYLGGE